MNPPHASRLDRLSTFAWFQWATVLSGILEKILVGEGVRVQPGCVVARLSQNADSTSSSAAQEDAVVNPGQMPGGTVSIFMPALSSTMTSGVVSSWLKKEGDKVEVRINCPWETDG